MINIAVFASGSGSDMQSVIDACEAGRINGVVSLVITNKENIFAVKRAEKHNIKTLTFLLKNYKDVEERDNAILTALRDNNIDIVVLAGYLSIVSINIIRSYQASIINIHPSLIPKHCGKGYYGLKVHESVINSGDKISGATVHFVEEGVDTGEIIEQIVVDVLNNDNAESLQKRVLQAEHILLPKVVAWLCEEKIKDKF